MTPPSNGITPEVIRDAMQPYRLSADLLAAALASIPPPPPGATQAWRRERAARLVQEIAGLMPADAPQARIAATILIVREATDDTFARVNEPGLTVEQVCRLRRTGSALTNSVAVLERMLWRHQQQPAPFFGTVLADRIDVGTLAAGWGGAGLRGEDAGESGGGGEIMDGPVAVGMVGTTPGSNARGQGLPAVTINSGPAMTQDADASLGVVARLDQGLGWTLDVVRARTGGDVVRPRVGDGVAVSAAPESAV